MDHKTLKSQIQSELPAEAFQPQPQRGLLLLPLVSLIVGGTWAIISLPLSWYAVLLLSIILGNVYAVLGLLGHEITHGSVFRSRWAQDGAGYLALFIFCFSPTLFRVWHNQLHHENTNVPDIDPDAHITFESFKYLEQKRPHLAKYLFKTTTGSGHWLSVLSPFIALTFQGQRVLWVLSKRNPKECSQLNRPRAIIESLLIISCWVAFAIYLGPRGALFAVIMPMAVGNAVIMSYILTNHGLRPLATEGDILENTMSVTTARWLDWLHLHISHHVEHHFFPNMNWRFTPLVRQSLLKHAPDCYLSPPHWKVLWWVYRTPEIHKDAHTFINPYSGKTITTEEVESALRS